MEAIANLLRQHPALTFFLVLGIGYLIGKLKVGGFTLGAVTGTLLAGVLVGQLHVQISGDVKQCFFLLFLFSIGFRTGPQFFRGLRATGCSGCSFSDRRDGGADRRLRGEPSVRLRRRHRRGGHRRIATESATIDTASDAISRFPSRRQTRPRSSIIPVAFAVTYLVGVVGAAWFPTRLAPGIMGVNLRSLPGSTSRRCTSRTRR